METNEQVVDAIATTTPPESSSAATAASATAAPAADVPAAAAPAADAAASAKVESETGTHQEHVKEALELLYQHFPKAFIKEGDCKPLKVGILEDLKPLIADIEGLSISKVRAAVRIYTTRLRYFYAVREGAMRIDLNGNEVEPVTAEHAEYARSRFSEINAKRRPPKPKKPKAQGRPAAKGGEGREGGRPGRGPGRGGRTEGARAGARPNNNNRPQRRYTPAKESDIRVGRRVFVSTNRNYVQATVSEALRGNGNVNVTLSNGLPVNIPLSQVFLSEGGNNRGGQGRRSFNGRPGQSRGPRREGGRDGARDGRDNRGAQRSHGPRQGGQGHGGANQGSGPNSGAAPQA